MGRRRRRKKEEKPAQYKYDNQVRLNKGLYYTKLGCGRVGKGGWLWAGEGMREGRAVGAWGGRGFGDKQRQTKPPSRPALHQNKTTYLSLRRPQPSQERRGTGTQPSRPCNTIHLHLYDPPLGGSCQASGGSGGIRPSSRLDKVIH